MSLNVAGRSRWNPGWGSERIPTLVDDQGEPSDALSRAAEAWDVDPRIAADAQVARASAAE